LCQEMEEGCFHSMAKLFCVMTCFWAVEKEYKLGRFHSNIPKLVVLLVT
jgi:hypothetical protein